MAVLGRGWCALCQRKEALCFEVGRTSTNVVERGSRCSMVRASGVGIDLCPIGEKLLLASYGSRCGALCAHLFGVPVGQDRKEKDGGYFGASPFSE